MNNTISTIVHESEEVEPPPCSKEALKLLIDKSIKIPEKSGFELSLSPKKSSFKLPAEVSTEIPETDELESSPCLKEVLDKLSAEDSIDDFLKSVKIEDYFEEKIVSHADSYFSYNKTYTVAEPDVPVQSYALKNMEEMSLKLRRLVQIAPLAIGYHKDTLTEQVFYLLPSF
jgi:hypothetical protein